MMALAGGTLVASIALAAGSATGPFAPKCRDQDGRRLDCGTDVERCGGAIRPMNTIPTLTPASGSASASARPKDPACLRGVHRPALPDPPRPDARTDDRVAQRSDRALPADPDGGPFMVLAKTFKGVDAERWALALVLELRNEYRLPAYILRTRDFPMRSNIRNIPPTAIREVREAFVGEPEKTRTHDEAAVLVGDEKTVEGAAALLKTVKKIKPKCLNGMPSIFHWRQGLSTAWQTTNPYIPAQDLFPRKADPLAQADQRRAAQPGLLPRTLFAPGRRVRRPGLVQPG